MIVIISCESLGGPEEVKEHGAEREHGCEEDSDTAG